MTAVVTRGRGNPYENAYCAYLVAELGYLWAVPTRQSRGLFDVHAYSAYGFCMHAQCKAGKLSCRAAFALSQKLEREAWVCSVRVVHRTKEKEFCEH